MTRRQFVLLILPLLLVIAGFVALHMVERVGGIGAPSWDADFSDFVRRRMEREFVFGLGDERQQQQAYFDALTKYLQIYDQYGEVVPPQAVDRAREQSSGQYVGIGILPQLYPEDPDQPVTAMKVIGVSPDGPAQKAGVRVDDLIVAVDGRRIAEFEGDRRQVNGDVATAIRGERKTAVRLGIRAADGVEREIEVTRDRVLKGSVFGTRFIDRKNGIGYLRVANFHNDTAATVRARIGELSKQGLQGLVLDLRQNPGGLFEQAVDLADLFVDDRGPLHNRVVVKQVGRLPEYSRAAYSTRDTTIGADLPMAVLIDRGSASASEIVAGALRDHRRAVVVGERSYGKFLVQTVTPEKTRFGPVLFKRTCAIYTTPLGRFYPRGPPPRVKRTSRETDVLGGIPPDIFIPLAASERSILGDVFEREHFQDWNPALEPVHPDFRDPHIEAAARLLRGETVYRSVAVPEAG